MRIAQVAHLAESIPPRQYGGTERVVSYLTEELVKLGYDVTLFASGDSTTAARLVPVCSRAVRQMGQVNRDALLVRLLEEVFRSAGEFDVIHSHLDFLGFPLIRRCAVPVLTTLHGRLDLPELAPVYREFSEVPLASISDSQRLPFPWANWQATVPHGLPVELYRFHPAGSGYLAFLGRISPEKSPDVAIRLAKRLQRPLRMAAKVDPVDQAYFEEIIEPLLEDPLVEYVGEITDAEKEDFLGEAAAVLCPYQPEPFGLVLIEALACGTPVITYRHGSFPEIIDDGVTGFLCDDEEAMLAAVERIGKIDRAACRRAFESRFTAERMARDYARLYHHLCASDGVYGERRERHPEGGPQVWWS
ncbi:glycosyltransferase family 4 protein [Candidatus Nitrospira bockiana]